MTTLHNEVLDRPFHHKGVKFTGTTVLDFDAPLDLDGNLFENCECEGPGPTAPNEPKGTRAVVVPWYRKPRTAFVGGRIHGGDKVVLGCFLGFYGTEIHDGVDGVFSEVAGFIHAQGGKTWGLAGSHPDGFQSAGGTHYTIRDWDFDLASSPEANSCLFFESRFAPCGRIIVEGCRMTGGNYLVYLVDDGMGPITNVRLIGNVGSEWRFGPVAWNTAASRPTMLRNSWQRDPEGADDATVVHRNMPAHSDGRLADLLTPVPLADLRDADLVRTSGYSVHRFASESPT